jgi:acetylornithine deacetylase/succinyl-diaminopimelate desuccinylase-like protein
LPGAAYIQIVVRGEPTYAPLSERTYSSLPENKNAIVKAAHLIIALEEWAQTYETSNETLTPCGTIKPRVTIGAVDGGLPYKPNWRPALANVYVDVRVSPNRSPLDIQREVAAVVRATGLSNEINMYLARMGYIGEGIEPIREALESSHQEIFSLPPNPTQWRNLSTWNDTNIYAEVGIPAVKYGPPGSLHPERVKIADIMNAARVYALSAVRLCGSKG